MYILKVAKKKILIFKKLLYFFNEKKRKWKMKILLPAITSFTFSVPPSSLRRYSREEKKISANNVICCSIMKKYDYTRGSNENIKRKKNDNYYRTICVKRLIQFSIHYFHLLSTRLTMNHLFFFRQKCRPL